VKWNVCLRLLQSYAHQLQDIERRLAEMIGTEQRIRHRQSGVADQQRDVHDPSVQQRQFVSPVMSLPVLDLFKSVTVSTQ